jgi:hypothetical protein
MRKRKSRSRSGWSASQREHFNITIAARKEPVTSGKTHLDRVRPKGPWSRERRARFEAKRAAKAAVAASEERAKTEPHKLGEHPSLAKEFTVGDIVSSMKEALNTATDEPLGRPNTIFVLEKGSLRRYVLRNVFIYVPIEKESSL